MNYNMFEYDKSLWGITLRHTNRLEFYDRVITPYNKSGKELSTFQEEVREIQNIFRVEKLDLKGNMPIKKVLTQNCTPKFYF